MKLCRTYCFSTLAINEMLMAYVCKTKGSLAFATKESWNNKALNIITAVGILLQIGILVVPPMRTRRLPWRKRDWILSGREICRRWTK